MKKFSWIMMLMAMMSLAAVSCEDSPVDEPNNPNEGENQTPEDPENPENPEELSFEIEIGEVTSYSVEYTVTPSDLEAHYLIALFDKETADEYTRDSYLISNLMSELETEALSKGLTKEEYLPTILDKGIVEDSFKNIAPDTDYYIVVFGVDPEMDFMASTGLTKKEFKTLPIDFADITFEVNTTVDGNSAEFEVTPSDTEAIWYLYTLPKSTFDNYTAPESPYEMDEIKFLLYCLQMQIDGLRGAGYTDNEILNAIFHKGALTLKAPELIANEEYIGMLAAFEVTAEGNISICSQVSTFVYTTGDVAMKELSFDISVTDIESTHAAIKVTPSNNKDSYCWMCGEWDGTMTAEDVMNEIVAMYGMWMNSGAMLYTGVQDYTGGPGSPFKYKLSSPDTDYYVIAFGYAGGVTTEPEMVTFRTLPAPAADTTEFTMTASNLSPYGFTANITATHDSTYYTAGICLAEEYNEERFISGANAGFDDALAMQQSYDPNVTASMVLDLYYYNGNNSVLANGMAPETEVMGYIFALDPKTGHVVKAHTFNPLAKTTAVGSVTPTVTLVGYYSGDEAYALELFKDKYGTAIDTRGIAITVIQYEGLDNARSLFTSSTPDDVENSLGFPDTDLWKMFNGYWNQCDINSPYTFYSATWEEPLTAVAYAIDNNGLIGGIGRLLTMASATKKGDINKLKELIDELNKAEKSSVAMPASVVVREEPAAVPAAKPAKRIASEQPMPEQVVVEANANTVTPLKYIRPFYIRK